MKKLFHKTKCPFGEVGSILTKAIAQLAVSNNSIIMKIKNSFMPQGSSIYMVRTLNFLLKTASLFLIAFIFSFSAKAQLAEFYYGLPNTNEVAHDVKRTSTNNTVIVGYSSIGSAITTRDYFITLIDPAGNVLWSRRGGTTQGDVLLKVIEAANGDFIAVGYSNENTTGNQANSDKRALILRYNVSGTLLWIKQYRMSATGSAGDEFQDICELASGDIVACGTYDARGNFADGLVAYMDASGNSTGAGFKRFTLSATSGGATYSDNFNGIATDGTNVYISGVSGDGSQYDGVVMQLNASGAVVYSNRYTYASSFNSTSFNWFTDIFIRNSKLVINAYCFNDYSASTSSLHGIVRMDLNGTNAQVVDIENFGYPTNSQCNGIDVYPLTEIDYFSVENPANFNYVPHVGLPGSDATISRIDAITPSVSLARSIPRIGEQTLYAIDVSGSIATMAGSAANDPANIGGYDVYVLNSDFNFTPDNECALENIAINVASPAVTIPALYETITTITPTNSTTFVEDLTPFSKVLLCGTNPDPVDSTDCPDKCYWKLDGNNSVSPTDFIGPKNNEDFRIRTNNQLRATIEKQFGNMGIGAHPNKEARLFIKHDGVGETDFHKFFLKAKYQTANDFFAITKTGSGASFTPLLWGHKESVDENAGLISVGTTNSANDYPSINGSAIEEFKAFLSDLNGQTLVDPRQRLLFNFGNLSKNFMKMSHYGYVGIGLITNTTYPTARLHVDCIDIDPEISNPSNIRFENLQFQDAPYILVIDDDGYVFRTDNPNYTPDAGLTQQSNTSSTSEVAKLQKEVDDLKALVYELSKQKTEQGQRPDATNTGSDNSATPYLIDNVPNPFSQSTLIRYYLPAGTTNAAITIINNEGIVMETVSLVGEGMGTLMYNASGLADGTYAYTLVVGGQKIDTKKMMITR